MYAEHQPLIAEHARSPQGFADVVSFVIATQNQRFYMVGAILEELRQHGIANGPYLSRTQKRGIAYAHLTARAHIARLTCDATTQLYSLLEIPAIGLVKAGFILQLCAGMVGCLDRHNLRTLGLSERAFDHVPTTTEALSSRIALYLHTCAQLGTPAVLYDNWCTLIAAKYPKQFTDADDVSYKHVLWCGATT